MSAKYTPGPWETSVLSNGTQWEVCAEDGGDAIARMVPQRDVSQEEHNARLIAEAPAMVEALRKVQDFEQRLRACQSDGGNDLANEIRAILARIEGSQ